MRQNQSGGFECAMNVVSKGKMRESYDADKLVVRQKFAVDGNTTRHFVQVYDVEPYKIEFDVGISDIYTEFVYELDGSSFYIMKGVVNIEYKWADITNNLSFVTDGVEWFVSTRNNDDDFGKYMVLKTFSESNDSKYVCGVVYNLLNSMVMRVGGSDDAKEYAHTIFDSLLKMLQVPIDLDNLSDYDLPIRMGVVKPLTRSASRSAQRSASRSAARSGPKTPPSVKMTSARNTPPSVKMSPASKEPSSRKSASKAPSSRKASPDAASMNDQTFIKHYMQPVAGLQKCVRMYDMIKRTKQNPSLGHFFFVEMDDIFRDDKTVQEFRKHVTENKDTYLALADKYDRDLKTNETWQALLAKFAEYKKRLRRIALFACHTDKLGAGVFAAVSQKQDVVERARGLMPNITSTVNGQLDSNDKESLLEELSVRDYIRPAPVRAPRSTAAPKEDKKTTRPKASSPGKCTRDGRTCSVKAAKDGRGMTKEELLHIALNHCDWGMTEAEIRRLTIPQLCARIKVAK